MNINTTDTEFWTSVLLIILQLVDRMFHLLVTELGMEGMSMVASSVATTVSSQAQPGANHAQP